VLASLICRLAMAAHAKRLARKLRQAIPGRGPVERSPERDAGLDAPVESRRARGVVTAEADAPHADVVCIKIAALLDEVEHGLHWHLVVAADRKVVLGFALSEAFTDQRYNPADKKQCLISVALFLGGIETDRHHKNRGLLDAHRLAQDAGERLALIRNFDAFAGWT